MAGVLGRATLFPGRSEAGRVGGLLVAPDAINDRGKAEGDGCSLIEGDVVWNLMDVVDVLKHTVDDAR